MASNDPTAFLREMLGQWDKVSGAGSAGATMFRDTVEKALAAANVPTKADIAALDARIAGIEAALFRIEGKLSALQPAQPTPPTPPQS